MEAKVLRRVNSMSQTVMILGKDNSMSLYLSKSNTNKYHFSITAIYGKYEISLHNAYGKSDKLIFYCNDSVAMVNQYIDNTIGK